MNLLSHPAEDKIPEKNLLEHLKNVAEKSFNSIENQKITPSLISKKQLQRLSLLIGLFHDFGKATTWFQEYISGIRASDAYTHHSFVSALVAYYVVLHEKYASKWAYLVFQIILRHHDHLRSYEIDSENFNVGIVQKQIENIKINAVNQVSKFYFDYGIDVKLILGKINPEHFKENVLGEIDELVEELTEQNDEKAFEYFFINNYLFSLLVDNDKKDAARLDNSYFEGNLSELDINVFPYLDYIRETDTKKFSLQNPVNIIRNKFLNSIDKNENIRTSNYFYTITAPTGIGKTFGCLVFANKLKAQLQGHNVRIIYSLPYTSIIDQNFEEFAKVIKFNLKEKFVRRPSRYLMKNHHLTEKILENRKRNNKEKRTYKDYLDDQLLVESWESAFIVTTFVQLLHSIFGYQNRILKKFHNIVNSIIILDEVQNIDPNYYQLIQKGIKVLAKVFHSYFLLVTATQPKLFPENEVIKIVREDTFSQNEIFNRVSIKVNKKPKQIEEILDNFTSQFSDENGLIVLNTKKIAIKFYKEIKPYFEKNFKLFCLTTYLTPFDRKKKISEIREILKRNEKIIVVSTQLIEAGVDLSFKKVFRDFAPLDSIVQVAGRCNRHGEFGNLGGEMNVFNLSNHSIYPKILVQYTDDILNDTSYTSNDFIYLTKRYFKNFNFSYISNKIIRAIKSMNYDRRSGDQIPISDFKIIPDMLQIPVYLLHTHEAEQNMKRFLELRDEIKNMLQKNNYSVENSEIFIEFEKLKYELNYFKISVYPHELNQYDDMLEPYGESKSEYPYLYISHKNCKQYVYDDEIGFFTEPNSHLSERSFW